MSIATQEIIRVCEALPQEKQREVADFARFLLAQQGDGHWEELLAAKDSRPKLDAFLRESTAEGGEAGIGHLIAFAAGHQRGNVK